VTNSNGPARLLLNQLGNRNHWLGLRLIGQKTQRDMLGARIEVVISKQRSIWRRVRTDGSYLSAHDPRVIVGLGGVTGAELVRVRWPDGAVEEWMNPRVDQYLTLKEGTGRPQK